MEQVGFQGLLETLLSPFDKLDLRHLYSRYHVGIDVVLYAFLLVYICRASLSKVFPGNAGQRLGTAVGIILALALGVAEQSIGFSLKSFGPIAAGLIILIVALVIFNVLRQANTGYAASVSISLVVTYFSMRAVLPGFFLWASANRWANYLHSILLVAILVAFWHGIKVLLPKPGHIEFGKKPLRAELPPRKGDEEREKSLIEKEMRRTTEVTLGNSKKNVEILKETAVLLKQHGSDKKVVADLCMRLEKMKRNNHRLAVAMSKAKRIDAQLLKFDLSCSKKLASGYSSLSPEMKTLCRKRYQEERKKVGLEREVYLLSKNVDICMSRFSDGLGNAINCMKSDVPSNAMKWLEKAIREEHAAEKLLESINMVEKKLLRLVTKQMKSG